MGLKYPIVAVDFDGTLTIGDNYPKIGEMNMVAIQYLKQYKKLGGKLIKSVVKPRPSGLGI